MGCSADKCYVRVLCIQTRRHFLFKQGEQGEQDFMGKYKGKNKNRGYLFPLFPLFEEIIEPCLR
jgi:hypothetical protein